MIITDIQAQNILKYTTLDIRDLPQEGLIAIEGANESGKSSIGETICFALFGRTFSLDPSELEKLIRWGESRCSVTLKFHNGDGNHYEIARFLDRDGNHGVRLNIVGQEDNPMARGTDVVAAHLYEMLGFGYAEFIESFYLAQREITTPHPHSYALKTMAGLSPLEHIADEYVGEIEGERKKIEKAQQEASTNAQELENLAIDPELLPTLEAEKSEKVERENLLQTELDALDEASAEYQDSIPRIRSLRKGRGGMQFFRLLSLLIALALGISWWLVSNVADHALSQTLVRLLESVIPGWSDQHHLWLLYGAGFFLLLFVVFWIRGASRNKKIRQLQESSRVLADRLSASHQLLTAERDNPKGMDEEEPQELQQGAPAEDDAPEEDLPVVNIDEEEAVPSDAEIEDLCKLISRSSADPARVREVVGSESGWLRDKLQQLQEEIVRLDQAIWSENERLKRADNHNSVILGCEQRASDHEHRIQLREIARELLSGASQDLSHRFNHALRDLVGGTLPMFTEGRYEHLQIGQDLTVRVFSNEKRDFMDLEEISSGTQRQIMLAVRLALSQELINCMKRDRQFLFLDEPFAFFDQERTRSAISVLPNLSQEISQVWIIAQEFPKDTGFDRSINCSREMTTLSSPS